MTSRSAQQMRRNAAINMGAFIAQMVASFILAPITLRGLGDDVNGIWRLIESVFAYLTMFDLGIASALVRYAARAAQRQDRDEMNRHFTVSVSAFSGIALLSGLIGAPLLVLLLPRFVVIPTAIMGDLPYILALVVIQFAVLLPLSVFPALLDGLNRFAEKGAVRFVGLFARIPLILWALNSDHRLFNLVLGLAMCNLAEHLVMAGLVWRHWPALRFRPRLVSRAAVFEIGGYSMNSFVALLAGRLSFQTDAFILGGFIGGSAITDFFNGSLLVEMSKSLVRSATTTLTPVFSALDTKGDDAASRSAFLQSSAWVLTLVLPLQVGILVLGPTFVSLWLGPQYAERSRWVQSILASALAVSMLQSVAARVLYGVGDVRWFSRIVLAEGIVNVLLSLALVIPHGIVGVAIGTAVPHVVSCLLVIRHSMLRLGIGVGEYLKILSWRSLAPGGAAGVAWLAAHQVLDIDSWLRLLGVGLVGVLAAGAAFVKPHSFVAETRSPGVAA